MTIIPPSPPEPTTSAATPVPAVSPAATGSSVATTANAEVTAPTGDAAPAKAPRPVGKIVKHSLLGLGAATLLAASGYLGYEAFAWNSHVNELSAETAALTSDRDTATARLAELNDEEATLSESVEDGQSNLIELANDRAQAQDSILSFSYITKYLKDCGVEQEEQITYIKKIGTSYISGNYIISYPYGNIRKYSNELNKWCRNIESDYEIISSDYEEELGDNA